MQEDIKFYNVLITKLYIMSLHEHAPKILSSTYITRGRIPRDHAHKGQDNKRPLGLNRACGSRDVIRRTSCTCPGKNGFFAVCYLPPVLTLHLVGGGTKRFSFRQTKHRDIVRRRREF